MIVAPQPVAVEEGAKVLMKGGNAVDAAVTCAFVQGVISPHMCGLGGYAVLTMSMAPNHEFVSLDAPALAGSLVAPDMWEGIALRPNPDGWGYFLKDKVNDQGYQSICAPGTVKVLSTMLQRWGTISWADAIAPAARIAQEGYAVHERLALGWKRRAPYPESSSLLERIQVNDEASRIYLHPDGRPREAAEILRNPDYGRTLLRLAEKGSDDFYQGELAKEISEDLAANGSYVTMEDLATYQIRECLPVVGTFRGYTVLTSPPPHGGPTLLAILNILESYDLTAMEHDSPEYIHLVSMAMKAAFADRNPYLGDPEFGNVPLESMISKERAEVWRHRIDGGESIRVSFAAPEPRDTTHVTVVDSRGNCIALTHSLGSSSGVITPGLGFMYNDSMVNFHPWRGHPNSIAPRKSRTTGMAPTVVYRDGKPVLVIGAPGANYIPTSLAQVIVNVLDFGMSVSDAVLAPRFDCQGDIIKCQARIPEYVCEEVRKKHPIQRLPRSHGGFALVHAIAVDAQTGDLAGAADTGAEGMALRTESRL